MPITLSEDAGCPRRPSSVRQPAHHFFRDRRRRWQSRASDVEQIHQAGEAARFGSVEFEVLRRLARAPWLRAAARGPVRRLRTLGIGRVAEIIGAETRQVAANDVARRSFSLSAPQAPFLAGHLFQLERLSRRQPGALRARLGGGAMPAEARGPFQNETSKSAAFEPQAEPCIQARKRSCGPHAGAA